MKIIGIVGKKQSGKDTVCEIIQTIKGHHRARRIAFADCLKEEVAMAIGKPVKYINENKEKFRLILQGWGTDFRRAEDDNYWINRWIDLAQRYFDYDYVIAPDVRFQNEASIIKVMGGELWRVRRHCLNEDQHTSEMEQDRILVNKEITNYGTKQELEEKIKKLI